MTTGLSPPERDQKIRVKGLFLYPQLNLSIWTHRVNSHSFSTPKKHFSFIFGIKNDNPEAKLKPAYIHRTQNTRDNVN
jgi:hypothetical protein